MKACAHQTRQQFGQPLSAFQATQLVLAEMATDCEAAALLIQRAAQLGDAEQSLGTAGSMAKLYATEAAQRVVDRAVQLGGGQAPERGHVLNFCIATCVRCGFMKAQAKSKSSSSRAIFFVNPSRFHRSVCRRADMDRTWCCP